MSSDFPAPIGTQAIISHLPGNLESKVPELSKTQQTGTVGSLLAPLQCKMPLFIRWRMEYDCIHQIHTAQFSLGE
jgi:hypothetical protein